MRRFIISSALGLLSILASCVQQGKSTKVESHGEAHTRTVSVQPFNALEASGVFELRLSQGSTESVRIEAPQTLQRYFHVSNEGDKLVVETKGLKGKALGTKDVIRVHITFKNLGEMNLNTVGSIRSEERLTFDHLSVLNKSVGQVSLELTAHKIRVKNTSVGNMILSGTARDAVFDNNSVGSLEAGALQAETVSIHNGGIGTAEVNASRTLWVDDHWLSKVRNKGAAPAKKEKKS